MKLMYIAAVPLALAAVPGAAQDHSGHVMPAAPAAKFSLETPIGTLLADPAAKAVLETNLPGISTHPHLPAFQGMSLTQAAAAAPSQITADKLQKIKVELATLK